MSLNDNSPTINKAIGRLTRKYLEPIGIPIKLEGIEGKIITLDKASDVVVQVLDLLGFLGVLEYSKFNPDEVSEKLGSHRLEVETLDKDAN